ncbi:MAG: aromatic ring-hydroxylating dioxygenase subunit alpha, partial [Myxococcales bacterium]|nr:aromatic ring-hydroxylating dioxygenase subunit alpha [Myxococcales bacterium]
MTATETGFGFKAAWYVAATSAEVTDRPLPRTVLGVPLVLFRTREGVGALLDRCPHRGVPLSLGFVKGGALHCGYHGWSFDTGGSCTAVPGLLDPTPNPARCVTGYPVREQQGHVWVWMDPTQEPVGEPFTFRLADAPGYLTVRKQLDAPGGLLAVAENALDVPHTPFVHAGLFRSEGDRNEITCVIERTRDRVEVEYIGEPRPEGIVARILSPSGGIVTHFDRFHLPCIVEVEYRIGEENHIVLNAACTPVTPDSTRLYAVVSVRSRVPTWLVRPIVQPAALYIFSQDVKILGEQTRMAATFGDRYLSTEIDLLGPHIARLLNRAER